MAYRLEDINYRTVADPKGMIEEADALYEKKVEEAAKKILENKKTARSSFSQDPLAPAKLLPR